MVPKYAVIPTNGRPCVKECLDAIIPQVDAVLLVENGQAVPPQEKVYKFWDSGDINISRWWNRGIDWARWMANRQGADDFFLAVLNDDAVPYEGWMNLVVGHMDALGAAAGCTGSVTSYVLHQQPGPVGLWTRMTGWAFVLRGNSGVRANQNLKWYFSDDYVDWTARELGGMVMVPGAPVDHRHPNGQMTPELQVQSGIDAATFQEIWGLMPW